VPVDHLATLINNSFYGNTAGSYGGAIYSYSAMPLIFNCIFGQDSANNGQEIYLASGSAEIAWSNIDTNKILGSFNAGFGIINEDPRFEDQIYLKPQCYSPCVDKGVYDYTCIHGDTVDAPEYDINGDYRPLGAGVDLGAYDTILCYEGILPVVSRQQSSVVCYPNPFSDYTTFEYELGESGVVTLMIFNHLGQQIAMLVNEKQDKGNHQVQWNAEGLPASVYFYRLTILRALPSGHADDYRLTTTGKLVKY
jgi:hypothetical protein